MKIQGNGTGGSWARPYVTVLAFNPASLLRFQRAADLEGGDDVRFSAVWERGWRNRRKAATTTIFGADLEKFFTLIPSQMQESMTR